ncbi:MAG: phosphatidylinositol kinase [Streptomycetaceae bacterium]|nr:MAG: phosphatidylinositol kinase [Streptomycetaceae bacterium]
MSVTGRLIDASNATLLASVTAEDHQIECIYKPVAGERPLWDFPDGTLAQREFAAYVISSYGGFNVVPYTLLREGPFGLGMVQEWIDIDESIDLMNFFSLDNPELRKMALFDAVINNTDRKIGHLLPTHSGEVLGCDHGVTFHTEDKLRTVLWQWAGNPLTEIEIAQLENLLLLIDGELKPILEELITASEIDATIIRINRLIDSKEFPQPSQEWPPVPWPAF